MTIPDRPNYQHQGPATHCVIHGRALGWLSCTAYSTAMAIDRATLGAKKPSGCAVRMVAGDTVGGLTIPQCAGAAREEWNVTLEVRVGANVCSPVYAARQLRKGRGFVLQGNTRPLLTTRFKATGGGVNHAVFVNEVRGGTTDAPREALVYDPAADGRYAWVDQGPSWWPWSLVKQFAAALRPWGDGDARTVGPGRFYVAITRDTEPHVHPKFGGHPTSPFPDRTRINVPAGRLCKVRSRIDRVDDRDVVARWADGKLFVAYQKAHGATPPGSTSDLWYGDHDGKKWVHVGSLAHTGGTT